MQQHDVARPSWPCSNPDSNTGGTPVPQPTAFQPVSTPRVENIHSWSVSPSAVLPARASLANAELGEDGIEDVVRGRAADDVSECAERVVDVGGGKLKPWLGSGDRIARAAQGV